MIRNRIKLFLANLNASKSYKGTYGKMPREEVEAGIDQAIRDVALEEKSYTFSSNLSGGMKRKLSVAIAFCK